ncbi:MAG: DNA polymerase III subunit gamma/tau [Cellvibrionaceae bacterium]
MSYQVLARKWRPRVFREMVGQEHVLKALINALDHDRLHHAYLFTGTRGVGKTSIARILAKCLNCEAGVRSEPCDQCGACREINEGRFVDLIEVDAASRTKVEDTRELLDNVQYAPSKGRFKVYLIDEVHMLSGHSFNALLKTLEEPPPHVKFLLATTDPQKLPVTILSRCLQFNLKNMSPERIVEHLQQILEQEKIPFETSALWQLGRSADGSMRDALSLTDQAISFGNGKVSEADVAAMLGSIDHRQVYDMLRALVDNDGVQLLRSVETLSEQSPDFGEALASLIGILHRVAIAQVLPESIDNTFGDRDEIISLAQQLPGEDVQLFYQTALLGRRDLPLAPEPRGGFEMVLLRMLAFRPQSVSDKATGPVPAAKGNEAASVKTEVKTREPAKISSESSARPAAADTAPSSQAVIKPENPAPAHGEDEPTKKPEARAPRPSAPEASGNAAPVDLPSPQAQQSHTATDTVPVPEPPQEPLESRAEEGITGNGSREEDVSLQTLTAQNWHQLATQLQASGVIQNTLRNCQLVGSEGNVLQFILDERNSTLYDESHQERLADILSDYFSQPVKVAIQVGEVSGQTPAAISARLQAERQAGALSALRNDARVQDIINHFSATLKEESVTPLDGRSTNGLLDSNEVQP